MKRKAQSFLDYAALIAIVAVSLIVMGSYVFKSIDARVAHIWFDLYDVQNGVR